MASIQVKNGISYVVYWYKNFEGESKQKWIACDDEGEANYLKRKIEEEKKEQTFLAPNTQTIEEFMEIFIDLYGTKSWGLTTYNNKVSLINNYVIPIIGKKKVQEFTSLDADRFIAKLQKTQSVDYGKKINATKYVTVRTIHEIYKLLRCAWNQAKRWDLVKKNVFENSTLPNCKNNIREIWNAKEIQMALELCDDQLLYLCINIAFACSARIGEITGIQWDCVFINDEDIEKDNARIVIDKQLVRAYKKDLDVLTKDEIYKVFNNLVDKSCKSTLILKSLKMNGEARTVWIPRTVAYMLREWKYQQQEIKNFLGKEYVDNNLMICFENGRPCEGSNIEKRFKKLIKKNNLKEVVFHSLRHSSATYKLKMSHGDVKSVQGDTGHRTAEMVTKRYAHILDEDRKINATKFDDEFYNKNDSSSSKSDESKEVNELLSMLKENESLRNELKKLLTI